MTVAILGLLIGWLGYSIHNAFCPASEGPKKLLLVVLVLVMLAELSR